MISYEFKRSVRARHLRITIGSDMRVIVTVPHRMNIQRAEEFVQEKNIWIEKKVSLIQKRIEQSPRSLIPKNNKKDFEDFKQQALTLIQERLLHFNIHYRYAWRNIAVKNITSRWGSCSKQSNLNFSYRILFLAPEVADYLIVHELCHLGEFNHSKKFWALIEQTIPNYKELRSQLKRTT